jgi:hypothetical protein
VVVGGMAVYYWTSSEAFLAVDIDVVFPTTAHWSDTLAGLGFERAATPRDVFSVAEALCL